MSLDTRHHAHGTELTVSYPWGNYISGRALCSDGKVRALKRISETADTFFSVPAAVTVKGKTVSGYITVTTMSGSSVPTEDDPSVIQFRQYTYGVNGGLLPMWPSS